MTTTGVGDEQHPNFHQKLIEESGDIATVIDTNGTITYVSPAVKHVLGYDPEDLVGENGFEYQPEETRAIISDAIQHVINNPDESQTAQTKFRRADGSWCWIETTLRNRLDDPVVGGILVMSRDISERKKQEQKYQELAEEYETLLDNVEDALFLLNVRSTDANKTFEFERLSPSYEKKTGLTTQQVRGKTPREVFGEERGAELEANYHRCVRASEPISYQEELNIADDARFWQTILAPVSTEGEITRLIGITRNVTDRVKQQRGLQRQNEQLEEFVSVVSHDLRNPLNVAQARIDLLSEEYESTHLAPTKQALDRMEEIIEDTLTLARQGQTVSDMADIELSDIIDECWQAVVTDEVTLNFGDTVTIRGDRSRLRSLFENLFRNAVEHGGTEVTVRVGQFGEDGIYVEDDGPGIPAESRETVLEPGHSSTSDGTGFGLTIVNRIAEAHGWELHITESAAGGARFEFENINIS